MLGARPPILWDKQITSRTSQIPRTTMIKQSNLPGEVSHVCRCVLVLIAHQHSPTWGFPQMWVPKNWWFQGRSHENPMKTHGSNGHHGATPSKTSGKSPWLSTWGNLQPRARRGIPARARTTKSPRWSGWAKARGSFGSFDSRKLNGCPMGDSRVGHCGIKTT